MSEFLKLEFEFLTDEQKAIIIALLGEMKYEGFEEEGDLLKAYIRSELYNEHELNTIVRTQEVTCSITRIEDKNWNELWESNFQPVVICRAISERPWVSVRAEFHKPVTTVEHDIIVTPKMSFGTGHHATTSMMIQMMGELDIKGKSVVDFGTGTGVLAILAEKLGALDVLAIDNDPHSIENATENFASNNCNKIELMQASSFQVTGRYDIILSNIAKTVILENLPAYADHLVNKGILLLSGILREDEEKIVKSAEKYRLILHKKMACERWLALEMIHHEQ